MPGKLILFIGVLLLIHAAFSARQNQIYVRDFEKENEAIPFDIVLECILAVIITSWGIVSVSGAFKPIRVTSTISKVTFDMLNSRPDFMAFNHRGKGGHSAS